MSHWNFSSMTTYLKLINFYLLAVGQCKYAGSLGIDAVYGVFVFVFVFDLSWISHMTFVVSDISSR